MLDYFYGNETEQYLFYQVPVMLVKEPKFKPLSGDAKLLYGLMLNRTSLSTRNNWRDEQGRVYIIYTIEEIMDDMNCSEKKAIKLTKELKDVDLIETVRRGLNKPNLIYVKNFATAFKYQKEPQTLANTRNCNFDSSGTGENDSSGTHQNTVQELAKLQATYINSNNIYSIQKESESKSTSESCDSANEEKNDLTMTVTLDAESHRENVSETEKGLPQTATPTIANGFRSPSSTNTELSNDYSTYRRIIQDNIDYNHFSRYYPNDIKEVDELIDCMLDVICSKGDTVKINGEDKSRSMVISQYLKLDHMDIEHILARYRDQHHKIKHIHSYLKTLLYTVKQENQHYYTNAVRADGVVW